MQTLNYPLTTRARRLLVHLAFVVSLVCGARAADGTATLSGNVSNLATGNLLEGARVEVPALKLVVLSDNTGRFVLSALPAGTHEIVASYTGLDSMRATVAVAAGQAVVRNFDLTTGIYKLDAFKVTGEREGGAAAITAARNAENLKNVAATDSFGNLPNMNAGEVAIRLPGIYGELDAGGNLSGFTVRGMTSGLNTVTMDGAMLTGQGGAGRSIFVNNITGAMFEQVELIKGHTPDKGADSLGGTINFKSRSPLSMREKRRVTYTLSARIAPSFTQQIPIREERRTHGLANLGYSEVFDAFGGSRNLGVNVSLFNSETALGWFTSQRDFQNTATQPGYLWDYRTGDVYNHRRQKNVTAKVDYRLSPATKLSFLASYIDHSEVYRRQYDTRAFTNQAIFNPAVATTAANGIEPGFTDRVTTVRPVAASTIDITMTGPNNFFNRLRRADLGAEHNWGPWQLEYNARYTQTHINIGNGEGGVLVNRLTGAGWIIDRRESDLFPKFIQNGGPDFTNPANYRPSPTNALTNGNNTQLHEVTELRADARYNLPLAFPVALKSGFVWREQVVGATSASRRWNYIGTGPLRAEPSILLMDQVKTGRALPQWEASHFIRAREVTDPTIWREDFYFRETTKYTGFTDATETVSAAYAMAQGKLGSTGLLGRTGFLGGVRVERTENEAFGWVRARRLSGTAATANEATAVAAAQVDYANNRRTTEGDYTKPFPSLHLSHDITPNLKARASWSTSFGRPGFGNLTPGETPNEANANLGGRPTLTINNPSLLPQTSRNWDATLEYYFEPVGNLSIGWFHKTIRDYIVSGIESGTIATGNDNGFNGEYPGWTILTTANAGTAIVQGWEFSYQQQYTFLPGVLKGLSGMFNYTVLDTHGKFTGTSNVTSGQVAGFVPRTANASLSWRYRSFSTRILSNYATTFLTSYGGASPWRNLYRVKRNLINLGFSYQVRPSVNLTLDIDNLTNVPQKRYRGFADQVEYYNYPGTTITVGVNGRF
ncbi:TonB-dependent receptor [Horticoccus sp. 23ND18S-11]|uniref:TonB-dependent receptor n=1 Tax=Horticoccus sp. 23ND18S-11 TaxID=3391832 RepID=UPI0039C94F61